MTARKPHCSEYASLTEMIIHVLSETPDIDEATTTVVGAFDLNECAERLLRGVVRGAVHDLQRAAIRAREHQIKKRKVSGEGWTPKPVRAKWESVMLDYFDLPDGRRVEWGKATAFEHRERAAWQCKLAVAIFTDAMLHFNAADDIEAAGVACLDELP